MRSILSKVMLYAKDTDKTSQFYQKHFGYKAKVDNDGGIIELSLVQGGISILIHQAGTGIKLGQACIKLVFDVKDVEKFRVKSMVAGLNFGYVHSADGYLYCNAKDPDENTVQISSRAYRKTSNKNGKPKLS